MQQNVGGRMQEEAEVVGGEGAAGGAVGLKEVLVVLDVAFHPAAVAIDVFVDEGGPRTLQVGHHEPDVLALRALFDLADDPLRRTPGRGLIGERCEPPHGLSPVFVQAPDLLHRAFRKGLEPIVGGQPEDEGQAVLGAKVVDLGTGEVAVAPQDDRRLRPGPSQMRHQALEDGHDLLAGRSGAGTQDRGDQPAALSFVDMQGLIAPGLEVPVEQGQLLGAVHLVFGIVYVQYDRFGRLGVGGDEGIGEGHGDPVEIASSDPVLEAAHRGLAGQVVFVLRQTIAGGFEARIAPQDVAIIGVFVSAGDLENALPEQRIHGVIHVALMPAVGDGLFDALDQSAPGLDLAQEQDAAVAGEQAAVVGRFKLFSGYACHRKAVGFILRFQGGFPPGVIVNRLSA